MILWPDEPLAVLDLETTGVDTATALPVQIACGILADHVQTGAGLHLDNGVATFLVNPGVPIPDEAAAIHGIHDADVADAPGVVEALSATLAMLHSFSIAGRPVVAYNARYDLTILKRLCDEHGGVWPTLTVIDPMVVDRHLDKWRKGRRTLTAVCDNYGVEFDGAAHDACADAVAAGRLALALADVYPQLRRKTPASLHKAQIEWYEKWRIGFNDYLARKHEAPEFVTGSWPL